MNEMKFTAKRSLPCLKVLKGLLQNKYRYKNGTLPYQHATFVRHGEIQYSYWNVWSVSAADIAHVLLQPEDCL